MCIRDSDYRVHKAGHRGFTSELVRTVSFAGLPLVFAEDVETTESGDYILSESVIGACLIPDATINGIPFHTAGNFGPGVLALASRHGWLYFSSTCRGGVQRI